jgi:hypothetical protein
LLHVAKLDVDNMFLAIVEVLLNRLNLLCSRIDSTIVGTCMLWHIGAVGCNPAQMVIHICMFACIESEVGECKKC